MMRRIKILHAHNYYLQPGGEDTAFSAEVSLLRDHGHQVIEYTENNRRVFSTNQPSIAIQAIWSWDSYHKLEGVLDKERPDLVHFHNTFPLISPSGYYACQNFGIPVIQSLDNPRLLCPSANFYRNGKLCQDCLGKTPPWPSIIHKCYHKSIVRTSVVSSMLSLHRWLRTWDTKVDYYVVATNFYKNKFIEGKLPEKKLLVKPHFISNDPEYDANKKIGDYALFIGRLDPEKGIRTLIDAWEKLSPIRDIPLKIRGDGQLENEVREAINQGHMRNAELVERLTKSELTDLIKGARFLIWPSEGYYETFGYVAVESFSCGVPVITSRIGVQEEIIEDGITGLHFNPGDPTDLAAKVQWAWNHPREMTEMSRNARKEYEEKYTAERNYEMLIQIYERAIREKHAADTGA